MAQKPMAASPVEPTLPPDYYLRNMETLLAAVLETSSHLFSPGERARLEAFQELPRAARMLATRLFLRRGPVLRVSRLVYPEIDDRDGALATLADGGFVVEPPLREGDADDLVSLLRLFRRDEIEPWVGRRPGESKEDLVARAAGSAGIASRLATADRFVSLADRPLLALLPLLFFGNRRQDLKDFVLVDLARVRYVPYAISRELPLFPDRGSLDALLAAAAAADRSVTELEEEALADEGRAALVALDGWRDPPPFRRRLDPGRYHARRAIQVAAALERRQLFTQAREIYAALAERGPADGRLHAVLRLSLVSRHLPSPGGSARPRDGTFAVASESLLPELDDTGRFAVELRRAHEGLAPDPRLKRRRAPVMELPLVPSPEGEGRWLDAHGEAVSIERAVLAALGGEGLLAENLLYRTLFGLLLWDEIFMAVPGMFQHAFQSAPLDAAGPDFLANRREAITRRLAALASMDVPAEVARRHDTHHGLACRFVSWDVYTRAELERAARSLGPPLLCIVGHLAAHPSHHGRGLPDLLVWTGEGARLLEVKGPGDQLRLEQMLWHDRLLAFGLDVRVVRVSRDPAAGESTPAAGAARTATT